MALEKETQYKGIPAKYWKINNVVQNILDNKAQVVLGLYANKEARDANALNFLERVSIDIEGLDLTREQIYAKIKESKKQTVVDVEEVKDENGIVTQPAQYKDVETNPFADAIDC